MLRLCRSNRDERGGREGEEGGDAPRSPAGLALDRAERERARGGADEHVRAWVGPDDGVDEAECAEEGLFCDGSADAVRACA